MSTIFKPHRGRSSVMSNQKKNIVLEAGEMFIELPDNGTGGCKMKIGDGTTIYSDLPYAMTGSGLFTGATSETNGTPGNVPAPVIGDQDKVLQGNGAWGHKLVIDIVENNGVYGYMNGNTFVPFKSQADIDAAVAAARVGNATAANVLSGKTFTNSSSSGLTGTMVNRSSTIVAATTSSSNTNIPCYRTNGSNIEVIPSIGYWGTWDWSKEKITIPVQEKTVTGSRSAQTVSPDSGKYLTKVTVNKYPDASGTYTPSGHGTALDMGATNNYRYVNTTNAYNAGKNSVSSFNITINLASPVGPAYIKEYDSSNHIVSKIYISADKDTSFTVKAGTKYKLTKNQ